MPPPSSLRDKAVTICSKDDGDYPEGWRRRRGAGGNGDKRQLQCAAIAIVRLMVAAREAKV